MASSTTINDGLVHGRAIHFGSLDFLADGSASRADALLTEIALSETGGLHFHVNIADILCLQDPASYRLADRVPNGA